MTLTLIQYNISFIKLCNRTSSRAEVSNVKCNILNVILNRYSSRAFNHAKHGI